VLYLFFGGNLESNGNNLEVFIDSRPGGQNRLLAQNPNVNNFNNMADDGSGNGLRFATGFEADFWLGFNGNGGTWYTDYIELGTTNGYFVGLTSPASSGTLSGGKNPFGIRATINNSNTGGVHAAACPCGGGTGGGCHVSAPAPVTTGIEFAIPLAAIGDPTDPIKVFAIINNQNHSYLSNQMLKAPSPCNPVPNCPAYIPNLGNPRAVNINSLECGAKYFVVTPPPKFSVASIAVVASGVTLRWMDLGPGSQYTVETRESPTGAGWLPAASGAWPITTTSWTDTTAGAVSSRCYRVHAVVH
jgi:hypothetical protein